MSRAVKILGIDPGLRHTGWGVILAEGSRLSYVASGAIHTESGLPLSERLRLLHVGLSQVIEAEWPDEAAVEETFVNRDPQSALKLGQARGIALVVPALAGLPVAEYSANLVKKSVTGTGHAEKGQVAAMLKIPAAEECRGFAGRRRCAGGRHHACQPSPPRDRAGRADPRRCDALGLVTGRAR